MRKIFTIFLIVIMNTVGNAQLLDTYDISVSSNGIIPMPTGLPSQFSTFVKYTKIQAPNGQAIHFIAQNQITDAMMVRARNILQFYLTNYAGSQYGADKTVVINAMGTNESILMLLNGSDDGNPPNVDGQPLYENEMAVEGHLWYTSNDYDNHRDASFEEILHMMHDFGIGVDTNGVPSPIGALPAYQAEIRAAQDNADNGFQIWPLGASSDPTWYNELAAENSLSQEYLAAVIDSYYGLWEAWTGGGGTTGMWGEYIAKTRAEIVTEDPMGYALMPKYFSPYININMDIDPTFIGVFNMTRTPSEPYTYKSQYLQHTTLTGTNASGVKGNDLANNLIGNDADNTLEGVKENDIIDGKGGADKAIFTGNYSDYTVTSFSTYVTVQDNVANRDALDTVYGCEILKFADQEIAVVLGVEENQILAGTKMYPNPSSSEVTLMLANAKSVDVVIFDLNGRQLLQSSHSTKEIKIDTRSLKSGLYLVKLSVADSQGTLFKRLIIR